MQKHHGMSSVQSKGNRAEQTEDTEKTLPPCKQRENTHVCVLEIKTVCLSPDSRATRSGTVMTITIWGILGGTSLMKAVGKLTTHLEMTFSMCSAALPGRRVAAR